MKLGKVVGDIVSTINHPFYDHKKLLVVDQIKPSGEPKGSYLIAVDSVGAGVGETVLVIDEGNSARQIANTPGAPVRSIIMGIVDEVQFSQVFINTGLKPGVNGNHLSTTEPF